jgi:hypothetical protein
MLHRVQALEKRCHVSDHIVSVVCRSRTEYSRARSIHSTSLIILRSALCLVVPSVVRL